MTERIIDGELRLAREKGMAQVTANIYDFNHQSREMFRAAGFRPTGGEWYAHQLKIRRGSPRASSFSRHSLSPSTMR